jgi:hypothetical protein
MIALDSLHARTAPFSMASIVGRLNAAERGVSVVDAAQLVEYDAYYYDRDREAPLPVVRVKFDDPAATWAYVDPVTCRIVAQFTRRGRVNRWLYHGLHSLDFSFWYYNWPAWTIGVLGFCAGGAVLSVTGVVIGFRRLRRGLVPRRKG